MRIIGFSSGATGKTSNVDRMVQAVMAKTGWESEFVKLTDLNFTGCKGCVDLCAKPQVCMAPDDLLPHYQSLKEADALVLGSPVYMDTMSATMRAFVERFFGYRHVNIPIYRKPIILVMAGCAPRGQASTDFANFVGHFNARILASLYFCSLSPPCLTCGRHQECKIGGLYQMYGEEVQCMEITPDMFKAWEDNPETVQAIDTAVEALKSHEE